ncbi:hypothetical protein FB446DRAFT_747044 [Lentinula raphanica]|nr:hypothetical protein FB446DRAFT_747044 [Lentinula raphanica]
MTQFIGAFEAGVDNWVSIAPDGKNTGTSEIGYYAPTRRMTIQPCWQKPQINLILIGETGSGKTALLNLLANTCAGIELDYFKAFHHAKNEQGGSQTGSQTNKPELYTIPCANGNEINILDTPGLADTRGIDMDNQHKREIVNAIKEHLETVDAIIVLVNGTVPRVNASTEYALSAISSMFPHSIVDNITFICTMVSNPADLNFDHSCLPIELRKAKIWSINNPFAQWAKYQEKIMQNPRIFDDESLEEMGEDVRRSYKKTLKILSKVFQFLDECQVQPTKTIHELFMMAIDMEAGIFNVIACMDQLGMKQEELRKLQKAAKEQSQQMFTKYEEIHNIPFYELETTHDQFNTICMAPDCYSNCHTGCRVHDSGFPLYRSLAHQLGTYCSAFKTERNFFEKATFFLFSNHRDSICNECKHSAEGHRKYRSLWVEKTKPEAPVFDEDAKRRDDEEFDSLGEMMDKVQKTCEELDQKIHDCEQELSERCEKYNQLALSGSFVKYLSSAIALLQLRYESMKDKDADDEVLQRMRGTIKQFEEMRQVLRNAEDQRRRAKRVQFDETLNTVTN